MIKCSKCFEEKDTSCFYTHSNGKPRKQCKECRNKSNRQWILSNPEKIQEIRRVGKENNYETYLRYTREWRKKNLAYDAFRARTYRARKQQQVPIWADLDKIKEVYLNCPKGYHVDHIVPLKGKIVSGLHVDYNLQYLTPTENMRKRNLYEIIL